MLRPASSLRLLVVASLSLLSACTVMEWGENKPAEVADPEGGPPPSALQVPPDLTRPNVNPQYTTTSPADAARPAQQPQQASPRDVEQRLQELKALRDKGLISEEELQQKRKAVLQSL